MKRNYRRWKKKAPGGTIVVNFLTGEDKYAWMKWRMTIVEFHQLVVAAGIRFGLNPGCNAEITEIFTAYLELILKEGKTYE